jgi:hypothetical protein
VPILEDDDMVYKIVLWRCLGYDGESQPVFDEPEEVLGDWFWRQSQTINAQGRAISLDAQMSLGESIPLDSRLWLADDQSFGSDDALTQWYSGGSAGQMDMLMRVMTYRERDDAKGIETRYSYGLAWYGDA